MLCEAYGAYNGTREVGVCELEWLYESLVLVAGVCGKYLGRDVGRLIVW